jgi:hypothetical protein
VHDRAVFKGEVPTHVCEPDIIMEVVEDQRGNVTYMLPSFLTVPKLVNLIVNLIELESPITSELEDIRGVVVIVFAVKPVMDIPETLANVGFAVVPTIADIEERTVVE